MNHPARWWHALPDGRLQCDLCPRECRLHEGQRAACVVRAREADALVLTAWGRSSGFCLDPIEKKPLYHFLPGSSTLSFGSVGCNLACKFCQNWDISHERDPLRLLDAASPDAIARAAAAQGAASVAFTYNDPVIVAEYAIDVAAACHAYGVLTVAVTAGYIQPAPRSEFFAAMDATNVDLKAFSEGFYHRLCGGHLAPVLDTLLWLHHAARTWLEITTLLIPGENDSDAELTQLAAWVARELGPDVPLHFTAYHPAGRLQVPPTPLATLRRARRIALDQGVRHVYIGNLPDAEASSTWCAGCGACLIARDGYRITAWLPDAQGRCPACAHVLAGHFAGPAQHFGHRRIPLHLAP